MSNFIRKGKRQHQNKTVKKHKKEMFRMIGQLKELAEYIYDTNPDINFNSKEAIRKEAEKITKRELDGLEVIILMNNLRNLKYEQTNNNN